MCLAVPVRVTELLPDGMARAEIDGVTMTVGVMMLDHVAVGTVAAGRESDPQIETGARLAPAGGCQPCAEQAFAGLIA